jgi:hypothetical protein
MTYPGIYAHELADVRVSPYEGWLITICDDAARRGYDLPERIRLRYAKLLRDIASVAEWKAAHEHA